MRTTLRIEAINEENKKIGKCKKKKKRYVPVEFENGDTKKQLLARNRYIIAKKTNE